MRLAFLLLGFFLAGADSDPARVEAPGVHNVFRITAALLCGSSPEGDEGFRSLKEFGVKSIISVDGARPDLERAKKHGLRYVHLPFGYDGIPRQRVLELVKAVQTLPGPIYLHCHHGRHRAPAAAAAIHLCLDERCTAAQAVSEMKRAGTDPHYTGLYAVPRNLARPTVAELDRIPADFPETAKVPVLTHITMSAGRTSRRFAPRTGRRRSGRNSIHRTRPCSSPSIIARPAASGT